MTEQQIFNRLNRCYLNCVVDNKEQIMTDEWYGSDDPKIWEWHRPEDDKYYRLVLNPDKTVTLSERASETDAYHIVNSFSSKEYMYEPVPELEKSLDDGPEI